MRTVLRIILFFSLNISLVHSQSALVKYKHPLFLISYPANWDTSNKEQNILFMAVEKRKNDQDIFRENFTVHIVNLKDLMTQEALLESAVGAFKQQGKTDKDIVEKGVKKNKTGVSYSLLKTKQHARGRTIVSSGIYFIKDKTVFVVTLSYDYAEAASYTALYNSVIDSFEIK